MPLFCEFFADAIPSSPLTDHWCDEVNMPSRGGSYQNQTNTNGIKSTLFHTLTRQCANQIPVALQPGCSRGAIVLR